ncbi:MAG: glycosyltransferase family 2 protein, partial [Actinomycetota bacterium]
MTNRMNVTPSGSTEVPAASEADSSPTPDRVSVVAAVSVVVGVDPQATLEAVRGQDHPLTDVRLIGAGVEDAPAGVVLSEDLEDVVAGLGSSVDYVWILHGDALPRPDALRSLVSEAERFEASLAGSKLLVAGTPDTLESVGSATDVFGEPYSGLDEGEVDLEQYDVVRDVAFVSSVSMLVRRDLLRGLRGLDPALAPVAAGLDLSQRVRIAGGRVIVVPSSEVFHQRRCGRGDGGWREQSGRMRAMLKAYRPITLAWMIPFAMLAGLADSLGGLLLGRWRLGPRYVLTWVWNLWRLPSTLGARTNIARVRQVGDEELFRYQVRGSVRLRQIGSELSDRILTLFDEDSAVAKRATEVWNSTTTWGVLGAVVLVVIGLRTIFLGGLPVVGYSLPFEDPITSLQRFAGSWNSAGLGSTAPVHPAVAPAATSGSAFSLVRL